MVDQPSKPVILSVLAHPDDETFGMGGTLAYYAKKGVDVYLICATRGEVGGMDPELMKGHSSIGEVREEELRCAAEVLGLKDVYFLDYRDSGMPGSKDNTHPQALAAAPIEEVAKKVALFIRKLKPQVVLTFDPIGGYRHPDHIAIQLATVEAFKLASDSGFADPESLPPYHPQRLYFHTIPRAFLKSAVFLLRLSGKNPRKFGSNKDIDLVSIANENFPVHASINYQPVREIRDRAAACHVSQGGAKVATGVQGWLRNTFQVNELFMQAYPDPRKNTHLKDLFDGVELQA
jgi:N-acetyl-1-D-myo-inositol-2-amino-2-deoxy-alpha-D-glucopyranoside deacetylase